MAADYAQWSWAKKFIIWNARPTGVNVGGGSYTTTKYLEKYEVDGFICAGKVLNPIFLSDYDARIVEEWQTECKLVSQLRHSNIVQFLGIYYVPGVQHFPVILRELLPGSLHDFLEARSAITLSRKVSVLQDVARALMYLHSRSPSVMHCNLTARKVLLGADMTAKVSVGSCSKSVGPKKLSKCHGSQLYMPPEAFESPPRYDTSLDMFSFGHLALFTATQVYPEVLPPHYKVTYDGSVHEYVFARNEIERRQDSFTRLKDMGKKEVDEKLVQLIKECLHDEPAKRPTARQALKKLEEIKDKVFDNDPRFKLEQALRPNETSVQQTQEIERLQRLYEVKKQGFYVVWVCLHYICMGQYTNIKITWAKVCN